MEDKKVYQERLALALYELNYEIPLINFLTGLSDEELYEVLNV